MGMVGFMLIMLWADACAEVTLFPGGHFQRLDPLTIYDTSFPLTYVLPHDLFSLPGISSFVLPGSPFPGRDLARLSATVLEMDRHIEDLQQRMTHVGGAAEMKRRLRAIDAVGDFLHWGFGTATDTELHSLTNNEEAVNKHLNSLQDVVKGDHLDLIHSIDEMRGFSANVSGVLRKVQTVVRGLQEGMKQEERVSQEVIYRDVMTHFVRLQTQVYHSLFLEATGDAKLKCRKGLLPALFVPVDVLVEDLQKLSTNISMDGFEVAISLKTPDVFYSLPITSCKISPRRIIVTVKVPVKKIGVGWKLFEYIPSPLSWKNYTCTLAKERLYVAVSGESTLTIAGQQMEACQPKSPGICLIPRQRGGASVSSTCVKLLMERAPVDELRGACPFYCEPSQDRVLVTQVATDTYILTNPTPTLSVVCSNSTVFIPTHVPGAIEINLPCNCSLSDRGNLLISRRFPCLSRSTVPSVTHILPVLWTSFPNISIHPLESWTRPVFPNLSHVLDLNWTLASPTFLVHNNFPQSVFDHVELPKTWWEVVDVTSLRYYIIYGWLGFLSLCIFYLIFKMCVITAVQNVTDPQPPGLPPRSRTVK